MYKKWKYKSEREVKWRRKEIKELKSRYNLSMNSL
jgi:hypothetical protein